MKAHNLPEHTSKYEYKAPTSYVGVFFLLLAAWTIASAILLSGRALRAEVGEIGQWLMILFVVAYTWYFSFGIFYKVSLDHEGSIVLTSFRRIIRTKAELIEMIEAPHFFFGFVRFRLEREKAYLFAIPSNEELRRVLISIRRINPDLKAKGAVPR